MSCHWPAVRAQQAILLPERFPTPRPTAPSLPRGQRAASSPHLLLGSAVTDVCNTASLSGRGNARAKSISLHAGIFHRAAEASSGKPQQHLQTQLSFPKICSALPGELPRQRGFRCVRGFSHLETGLRQAAEACRTFLRNAVLWQGLSFGANSTSPLLPQQVSVASGKKSCGGAGASWALLSGLQVNTLGSPY